MDLKSIELWFDLQMQRGLQSPFLAHIDFGEQDPSKFLIAVKTFLSGNSWRFLDFQKLCPRFSVWALCRPLSEAYGEKDTAFGAGSVWPRIGKPYGINIDDINLRKLICNNFRSIADRHHLCYGNSGLHRDVDDLLTQAGVAVSQLIPVARTFLAAERIIGLPDVDTTEAINKWEDDSAHFLTNNPVAERVLLADYTAYYARVFIGCRKGEKPTSPFEEAFHKIISDRASDKTVNDRLDYSPQLIWANPGLAIKMPERAGPYILRYKDSTNRIIGPIRCRKSQLWRLPFPWPNRIDCVHEKMDQSIKITENNDELLIFSADSNFLTNRLQVNLTGTVWVADSNIILVSESPYRISGFSVSRQEKLYICYMKLGREGVKVLRKDGGIWDIRARPRLRCKFKKMTALRSEGQRLPLLSRRSLVEIETTQLGIGCSVVIKSNETEKKIEYDFEDQLTEELILGDYISPFDNPTKISVTIYPKASDRQSHKISGFIWPAIDKMLDETTLIFHPERVGEKQPAHLDVMEDASTHIRLNSGGLALREDETFRRAVVCIKTEKGPENFIWKNSLDSIILVDETGEERLVDLGSDLLLPQNLSHSHLILNCTSKDAKLNIGGRIEEHPFKSSNQYIVRLGEFLNSVGNDRISLIRHHSSALWVQIKRATKPEQFSVIKRGPQLSVSIKLNVGCENIVLEGESISGEKTTVFVPVRHVSSPEKVPSWIHGIDVGQNGQSIKIDFNCSKYSAPLTVFRFAAQVSGKPIRAFLGEDVGKYNICLSGQNKSNDSSESSLKLISQLLTWLNSNHAREVRTHINEELLPLLNRESRTLSGANGGISKLLACEHAQSNTHLNIGNNFYSVLAVFPDLYSGDPYTFTGLISDKADNKKIAFYKMYEWRNYLIRQAFSESNLSVAFLSGYQNFIRSAATGESLEGFNFKRYCNSAYEEAASEIRSNPNILRHWNANIKILSGIHYLYALKKFEARFSETRLLDEGNTSSCVLNLGKMRSQIDRIAVDVMPWPESQHSSHPDFFQYCVKLLSAFAKASRHGMASEFSMQLAQTSNIKQEAVLSAIARCIHIGPELFSFYLLLNELSKRHP